MKRRGIAYDHLVDKNVYYYRSDDKFLYWRTDIISDILRAPSGDGNLP